MSKIYLYTDYPFVELGDIPNQLAPIRRVEFICYDNNKYADIIVENRMLSVKLGYLYPEARRFEDGKSVSYKDAKKFNEVVCKMTNNIDDYDKAKELGLTKLDRWGNAIAHHSMSERLMNFLAEHDFNDYDDCFCWKVGGDGDNGETLMYQMDAFFEMLDKLENNG